MQPVPPSVRGLLAFTHIPSRHQRGTTYIKGSRDVAIREGIRHEVIICNKKRTGIA
jgi:hypothetical protein